MEISLPFAKFSIFQSLNSPKQLQEIKFQMVSTIDLIGLLILETCHYSMIIPTSSF